MRLIDADALLQMPWVLPKHMTREIALVCFDNIIKEQPTIEAEPVVRCKDCKFFKFGDYCFHDGKMEHSKAREDDYCSYGRRK